MIAFIFCVRSVVWALSKVLAATKKMVCKSVRSGNKTKAMRLTLRLRKRNRFDASRFFYTRCWSWTGKVQSLILHAVELIAHAFISLAAIVAGRHRDDRLFRKFFSLRQRSFRIVIILLHEVAVPFDEVSFRKEEGFQGVLPMIHCAYLMASSGLLTLRKDQPRASIASSYTGEPTFTWP